jgi:hypothetical protein
MALCMSVYLSLCMGQFGSHWTDFNEIWRSSKWVSYPYTGLDGLWGLQDSEAPRIFDIRQTKLAGLLALRSGRLNPLPSRPDRSVVLISVTGCVDLRAIVRPEGLGQWKISNTRSGIDPATFRLVARFRNLLRYRVLQIFEYLSTNFKFR